MHIFIILVSFTILFFLDFFLKEYVSKKIKGNKEKIFFNKFIRILYVENRGIAFNLLENRTSLILISNLFLLSYIFYLNFSVDFLDFPLMLIFCGGIGNFADRLIRGFVVDYIYFSIKKFPVFNLSDFYIIIGAFSMFFKEIA